MESPVFRIRPSDFEISASGYRISSLERSSRQRGQFPNSERPFVSPATGRGEPPARKSAGRAGASRLRAVCVLHRRPGGPPCGLAAGAHWQGFACGAARRERRAEGRAPGWGWKSTEGSGSISTRARSPMETSPNAAPRPKTCRRRQQAAAEPLPPPRMPPTTGGGRQRRRRRRREGGEQAGERGRGGSRGGGVRTREEA